VTKQVLPETTISVEDKTALAILENSKGKDENHYIAAMLWKREPALSNNHAIAAL